MRRQTRLSRHVRLVQARSTTEVLDAFLVRPGAVRRAPHGFGLLPCRVATVRRVIETHHRRVIDVGVARWGCGALAAAQLGTGDG
jgi:hypothetical protein